MPDIFIFFAFMNEKMENGPRQALPDKETPLWALLSDEQLRETSDLSSSLSSGLFKNANCLFIYLFFALAVLKKIIPALSKTCICIFSEAAKDQINVFLSPLLQAN